MFKKCKIRAARYKDNPYPYIYEIKYDQTDFCIDEKEDFVWIKDYKKSLLKEGEHELFDENPCLIIVAKRFEYLFKCELVELLKEIRLSSVIADNLTSNLDKKLRKLQVVYKQKRTDSKWGRYAVDYPVYEIKECKSYDDWERSTGDINKLMNIRNEHVVQINTKLPCVEILKERMKNEEYKDDEYLRMNGGM